MIGCRGGTTVSLDQAIALYECFKADQLKAVKVTIMWLALTDGEFHGDQLAEFDIAERNIIGAAVNALVRKGLLENTGEHRRGSSPASHGRRSYVYVLSPAGRKAASGFFPTAYPRQGEPCTTHQ